MLSQIPIDLIFGNPDQPRKTFDEAALRELADSIESTGLLQPITVRAASNGRFMIVAGERRWRAHKILADDGRLDAPVILAFVRELTDDDTDIAAIVENLQRADISPLEESDAFARLASRGMSAEEIAKKTGAAVFRVKWRLTLQNLAPDIRRLFATGNLDRQQALELARLDSHEDQGRVLRLINSGRLVGWKAVRNSVDAVLNAGLQTDFFGGKPNAGHVATVDAMELRIDRLAFLASVGWKDGECKIAAKVNPDAAGAMADKLAAIQKCFRVMERELRNVVGQASLLDDA